MLILFAVLSMFGISIQASLLSIPTDARSLLSRQYQPPSVSYPQCSSVCDSSSQFFTSCPGDANYLHCTCSQSSGQALVACFDCVVGLDPSYTALYQSLLDDYVTGCNSLGVTFNPPLTVIPSASATQSTSSALIPSSSGGGLHSSTTATGPAPSTVVVSATDPGIKYSGNWADRAASCLAGATARQCQGAGNTFSYTFDGSGIAMKIGENKDSGKYDVELGGVVTHNDAFSSAASPACNVSYNRQNLGFGPHTIKVKSLGVSPQASSSSQGTFELVNFVIMQDSSQSGSSSNGVNSLLGTGVVLGIILMIFV